MIFNKYTYSKVVVEVFFRFWIINFGYTYIAESVKTLIDIKAQIFLGEIALVCWSWIGCLKKNQSSKELDGY